MKLVDLDDPEWNQKVGDFSSTDNLNNRNLALAFAVRDNIDAEGVDVRVKSLGQVRVKRSGIEPSGQFNVESMDQLFS